MGFGFSSWVPCMAMYTALYHVAITNLVCMYIYHTRLTDFFLRFASTRFCDLYMEMVRGRYIATLANVGESTLYFALSFCI